ncbi:MAG: lipase [Cyanobacteria bacterium RYN_339]|nr:lipase [Cyanobacteria bacterium RYN_339]
MHFLELPAVYARLGGLLAGSVAKQVERVLPQPLACLARGIASPIVGLLPLPIREGWALAHREEPQHPVLMVPGFMGPGFLLTPLAVFLRAHGRTVHVLSTFPALGGVEASAHRIVGAIARLREETGAAQVDLVAHSMGGLACRYYMNHLMESPLVRRFVSIATPHKGTHLAHFPFTRSAKDMRPGGDLLAAMADRPPAEGVRCYTIRAGWDQIVVPRHHGRWEGHARDHELPWAEHWAVQLDPRTLALVLALLEEDEPAEVIQEPVVSV